MAKKKAAKKSKPAKKVAKPAKKMAKKSSKKPSSSQAAPTVIAPEKSAEQSKIDVSDVIKKDEVIMPEPPAEMSKPAETAAPADEKHEDFAKALTQEPPKKGFWARLFGK